MPTKDISPRFLFNGILLGGAALFFLVPGVLTDLLAVLLLSPVLRAGLSRWLSPHAADGGEDRRRGRDSNIIEGEFTRID